jgi:hypothetical protein
MTNADSIKGQTAVCCQNLTLGALSSCSTLSVLVGTVFKKVGLFLNMPRIPTNTLHDNTHKNSEVFCHPGAIFMELL